MAKPMLRAVPIIVVLVLVLGLFPNPSAAAAGRSEKVDPALQALLASAPNRALPVIVEATHDQQSTPYARAQRAAERVRANHAQPKANLGIVGATSALADAGAVAALSRDPAVSYVYYDRPLRTLDALPASNVYQTVVEAPKVTQLGYTGKGVGVAVLDSGVNAHADLTMPSNRVPVHVNLVGDSPNALDPGGHGTHIAGIIAGNGFGAPLDQRASLQGIAPDANIVDVRVINQNGETRLSTVILGTEWVVQHRSQYNIRVLNVSLGTAVPADYSYRTDPLASALELAWLSGIVVVVAAGNDGPNSRTINSPGTDPMLLTVGALDDAGTIAGSDDRVATFSSRGPTPDGIAKPDVIAPGRRIVSLRSPGSYLDTLMPERVVTTSNGTTYTRLSGTSMATAVVSGVAALVLEANPRLRPDQVKGILTATSTRIAGNPNAAGAGVVNAAAAISYHDSTRANVNKRPGDAVARALLPLVRGQALHWRDLHYAGRDWAKVTWDNILWDNILWDNILWDNILWDNILWDNILWDNILWDNILWDTLVQGSGTWAGSRLD